MKIRIKADKMNLYIPVPLWAGGLAIRIGLRHTLDKEQRKIVLKSYKVCKKHLKRYKGLELVNVETSTGEKIRITV